MIWWLPDFEIGAPPIPDAIDIRRMAVDAVRDGLAPDLVARLFGLDPAELQALVAAAPEAAKYALEPIDEAAETADDSKTAATAGADADAAEPDDAVERDDASDPADDMEERAHADH